MRCLGSEAAQEPCSCRGGAFSSPGGCCSWFRPPRGPPLFTGVPESVFPAAGSGSRWGRAGSIHHPRSLRLLHHLVGRGTVSGNRVRRLFDPRMRPVNQPAGFPHVFLQGQNGWFATVCDSPVGTKPCQPRLASYGQTLPNGRHPAFGRALPYDLDEGLRFQNAKCFVCALGSWSALSAG